MVDRPTPRPHFAPIKLRSGYYARNVGPLTLQEAREVCRMAQAAPGLLAALREARNGLCYWEPQTTRGAQECARICALVDAAIAKATGQEPGP